MKAHKPSTVKRVLCLLDQNKSTRQVAKETRIPKSTVYEMSKKLPITRSKSKGGRPRKLAYRDALFLRVLIHRGELSTAIEAAGRLNTEKQDRVSVNTVRRALHDIGMVAKKAVKKPLLTARHKKARLEFAKKYRHFTEDDWKRVIWSDESKINRISSDGLKYVWIDSNKPPKVNAADIDPALITPTVKHGGGSIMVWSCMTWYGPGFWAKIDTTLDAELYVRILTEDLWDTVNWYDIDPEQFIFQHDNDPKHTSQKARDYLASIGMTEASGRVLTWPAQSPDLNPIEHLWTHLKRKLRDIKPYAKGEHELWERITQIWNNEIPMEVCQKLIRSMPDRLEAVIKAKGGHTKY
jgi:transposase